MALSDVDRRLLQRCMAEAPHAWEEFVDRFLGLVLHVVDHTARVRSLNISAQDREDLAAEVFLAVIANDFRVLRKFKENSSLATYLTVIARRIVVRELLKRKIGTRPAEVLDERHLADSEAEESDLELDHISHMLEQLASSEADVVRMYHLDGLTYREISNATGMPENSIGPTLTRARAKLKKLMASS